MKVIGLQEVIECNAQLQEKKLFFKVHLRDACGKQSLWVEQLSPCHCEEQMDAMYECVEEYFKSKGYVLAYSADKLNFWVE